VENNEQNYFSKVITGKVQEVDFWDSFLNLQIKIEVSDFYTKIKIGSRTFYFDSDTGKYDGTGQIVDGMTVLTNKRGKK